MRATNQQKKDREQQQERKNMPQSTDIDPRFKSTFGRDTKWKIDHCHHEDGSREGLMEERKNMPKSADIDLRFKPTFDRDTKWKIDQERRAKELELSP